MTAELLRAFFPLTARHHFVACARVALHYAWLPYMVGVELVALAGEAHQ
jgi:hypothetical protein